MRWLKLLVPAMALAFCVAAQSQSPTYDLGRTPSEREILAWDTAVGPAGKELPDGERNRQGWSAALCDESAPSATGQPGRRARLRVWWEA